MEPAVIIDYWFNVLKPAQWFRTSDDVDNHVRETFSAIHQAAVRLFSAPGLEKSLSSELKHQAIIGRFGRFPHRNSLLERHSTPDELAFLSKPGSRF